MYLFFLPVYMKDSGLEACFEAIPSGAQGRADVAYPYSLPLHSPSKLAGPLTAYNLSHQSLFLRSRCFPMSAGPLTKQDGEPSSFKVLHMSLPSLLSFPLPTPTFGIPMGHCPVSNPDGGKTRFNRCPGSCAEPR